MASTNPNTLEIGTLRLRAIKNPVDLTVRIRVEQSDNGHQDLPGFSSCEFRLSELHGYARYENHIFENDMINKVFGQIWDLTKAMAKATDRASMQTLSQILYTEEAASGRPRDIYSQGHFILKSHGKTLVYENPMTFDIPTAALYSDNQCILCVLHSHTMYFDTVGNIGASDKNIVVEFKENTDDILKISVFEHSLDYHELVYDCESDFVLCAAKAKETDDYMTREELGSLLLAGHLTYDIVAKDKVPLSTLVSTRRSHIKTHNIKGHSYTDVW